MPLLELQNISKSFGKNKVLQDVNLFFEEGKIHTLIGGNGSGKTTLFNIITGFVRANKGKIIYNSKPIQYKSPAKINQLGITRTFQDLRIINQLTVRENILLSFKNNPGEKMLNSLLPQRIFQKQYDQFAERTNQILDKIHLIEVQQNLAGEISYGQQKLLTIGCCLANDADLLLLDEPVAGIDRENYKRIYDLILQLREEGKTILQVEHNHGFVESLSDTIWFLNAGTASIFNDYNSFISNPIVKQSYLN